jgi:uncharacterized protein YbjT (DUF2867 family)
MGIKVFVTGGTGFVGSQIVREWVEAGRSVHILARNKTAIHRAESVHHAGGG